MTEGAREILRLLPRYGVAPLLTGVEVGTLRGETAADLLQARPDLSLLCVDSWEDGAVGELVTEPAGEIEAEARRRLSVFPPQRCSILKARSLDAAAEYPQPRDFVFIDADHSYAGTLSDINAWWPHVRPGGLLIGHDFGRCGPRGECAGWNVARAVGEWSARKGLPLNSLEATVWSIRKPTA